MRTKVFLLGFLLLLGGLFLVAKDGSRAQPCCLMGVINPIVAATNNCATIIGQVSGIIGCWNADQGVATSGSNVTSWTDQSSNGYVLGLNQLTGEPVPTSPTLGASSYNSKKGITFAQSSGNYLATVDATVALGTSIMTWCAAVIQNSTTKSYARLLSFTNDGASDVTNSGTIAAIIQNANTSNFGFFQASTDNSNLVTLTLSTPSRVCLVFNGTNGQAYLNNVAGSSAGMTNTMTSPGRISVGDATSASSAFFDGVVRRIIVTNTAVSSTDRSNIDTWLQN